MARQTKGETRLGEVPKLDTQGKLPPLLGALDCGNSGNCPQFAEFDGENFRLQGYKLTEADETRRGAKAVPSNETELLIPKQLVFDAVLRWAWSHRPIPQSHALSKELAEFGEASIAPINFPEAWKVVQNCSERLFFLRTKTGRPDPAVPHLRRPAHPEGRYFRDGAAFGWPEMLAEMKERGVHLSSLHLLELPLSGANEGHVSVDGKKYRDAGVNQYYEAQPIGAMLPIGAVGKDFWVIDKEVVLLRWDAETMAIVPHVLRDASEKSRYIEFADRFADPSKLHPQVFLPSWNEFGTYAGTTLDQNPDVASIIRYSDLMRFKGEVERFFYPNLQDLEPVRR